MERHKPVLTPARDIFLLSGFSLLLALVAFLWNHAYTGYPGANYLLDAPPVITLLTGLLYAGCRLQAGEETPLTLRLRELCLFVLMLSVILLMTNAVQFTPFHAVDKTLYTFESMLHLDVSRSMTWLQHFPLLERWLWFCYRHLALEILVIPLLVILAGHFETLREYCFMMLATALVGFTLYYFFPTTAPASILDNPRFTAEQYATGFKFWQIHRHIAPTTVEGGMISLPSYHVIWAVLCLRLTRAWAWLYYPLWAYTASLIAACVLLGWHYYVDIAASFALIGLAQWAWKRRLEMMPGLAA